uniref:Uncharacterized protein n=1 Tax=Anguilla anguilla TaxID=7936 RepID=A0A0E9S2P7_ANGAN
MSYVRGLKQGKYFLKIIKMNVKVPSVSTKNNKKARSKMKSCVKKFISSQVLYCC